MTARRKHSRWLRIAAVLVAVLPLLAFLVGCTTEEFPQSALHPKADYAHKLHDLMEMLSFWVVVIFVLVQGLLIFAVIKFRSRPGSPDPKPIHGNTMLEVAWTIAPAILLTMIAIPTVLTTFDTQRNVPEGALKVHAIGHQWWWEFKYPEEGVTTASDMVLPVGRPVQVMIESADVLHSFWFPAMGGKRDAIPARTNTMWFTPEEEGIYPGQCAELCGTSHANMRMKLRIVSESEYADWIAHQLSDPVEPDSGTVEMEGKIAFSQSGCIACHTVQGVSFGVLGPNLTHVGSRMTLAGGIFENTPEEMEKWILDAPSRKPGAKMLTFEEMSMSHDLAKPIVAYLQSLK